MISANQNELNFQTHSSNLFATSTSDQSNFFTTSTSEQILTPILQNDTLEEFSFTLSLLNEDEVFSASKTKDSFFIENEKLTKYHNHSLENDSIWTLALEMNHVSESITFQKETVENFRCFQNDCKSLDQKSIADFIKVTRTRFEKFTTESFLVS